MLRAHEPIGEHALGIKQVLVERAHQLQPGMGEFAAAHADHVQALEMGELAADDTVGNHVAAQARQPADHRLRADAHELMCGRQTADVDEIADLAVTAEGGGIGENHIVADMTIVTDMAVGHEEAPRADRRHPAALHRTDVHGHGFADRAAFADLQAGRLAAIAQILRRTTERGEGMDDASIADRGVTCHAHMRHQPALSADRDIGADGAKRTDRDTVADNGTFLDAGGGIDHAHQSTFQQTYPAGPHLRRIALHVES